ncbi:MAG: NACHT domain-containing protein [Planctomycetota bacterium]
MQDRVTGKWTLGTLEKLEKRLNLDGKLLKDGAALVTFATVATGTGDLQSGIFAGLITKTAGAALTAGTNLLERLRLPPFNEETSLPTHERFQVLTYCFCMKSFVAAVDELVQSTEFEEACARLANEVAVESPGLEAVRLVESNADAIRHRAQNIEEAELYLQAGSQIDKGVVPLLAAFSEWLANYLADTRLAEHVEGLDEESLRSRFGNRLTLDLASDSDDARAIRDYLGIQADMATIGSADTMGAVHDLLKGWIAEQTHDPTKEKWDAYREHLRSLPDQSSTMFAEDFGVAEVFQVPMLGHYIQQPPAHGVHASQGSASQILGALLSQRYSSRNLMLLCGGPGSGKSTLCRMLVSVLAEKPNVHPVFIRLRQLKQAASVDGLIIDHLTERGLITRVDEIAELTNLYIILDGFDEVVMADRNRLTTIFRELREALEDSRFQNARVLIAGRDTLFPNGDGLPLGAHILKILPFDERRVTNWGRKWRGKHPTGPGKSFAPENYLDKNAGEDTSDLHELATWPLTLHLIARVHTSGGLDGSPEQLKGLRKAYLYRSILAEIGLRQQDQVPGEDRLSGDQLRQLARACAWMLYCRGAESAPFDDVRPLIREMFPDLPDEAGSRFTEVAICNTPQFKQGAEGGFEFIHKTFAEFLVAEHITAQVEQASQKGPSYSLSGKDEIQWLLDDEAATSKLGQCFAVRSVPEEILIMVEPMLGCLRPFIAGSSALEVVPLEHRREPLRDILARLNNLFARALLEDPTPLLLLPRDAAVERPQGTLQMLANYVGGLADLGGCAASEWSGRAMESNGEEPVFNAEPFEGAFWRYVCLRHAGGASWSPAFSRYGRAYLIPSEDRLVPFELHSLAEAQDWDATIQSLLGKLEDTIELARLLAEFSMLFPRGDLIQSRRIAKESDGRAFETVFRCALSETLHSILGTVNSSLHRQLGGTITKPVSPAERVSRAYPRHYLLDEATLEASRLVRASLNARSTDEVHLDRVTQLFMDIEKRCFDVARQLSSIDATTQIENIVERRFHELSSRMHDIKLWQSTHDPRGEE